MIGDADHSIRPLGSLILWTGTSKSFEVSSQLTSWRVPWQGR